jgi:vanillate O-demethylase monooxygenase subunit
MMVWVFFAGISEQVGTKPVGVEILGMKLVLFRGKDGTVKCVNDVCPHRGAPLHRGWVQEVNMPVTFHKHCILLWTDECIICFA